MLRGFRKIIEQIGLADINHTSEGFEHFKELIPGFQQALVMERQPPFGVQVFQTFQTGFEVFQVRPGIAIVRPEAG